MKSKSYFIVGLAVLFLTVNSCKKKEKTPDPTPTPSPLATLATSAITSITDSTAMSGGVVSSEGTSAITAVGICWDTLPSPTTLRNHTNDGAGTGSYTSKLIGLKLSRTYYVRAYATNSNGTAYGNEISFAMAKPTLWSKSANNYTFTCLLSSGVSIFAGTSNGIIFSADTGSTWVSKGLSGVSINKIIQKGTTLFAMGWTASYGNEAYRSTDNGNSWASLTSSFPYPVHVNDMTASNNKILAGTDSSAFYSLDNGNTWSTAWNGIPLPGSYMGYGGSVYQMASTGQQAYAFTTDWSGTAFLSYMKKYDDATNSWSSSGFVVPQYSSMYSFVACGTNVFISVDNQSWVSKNGGNWTTISGLPASTLRYDATGTSVVCSSTAGYFSVSVDYGNTWTRIKSLGLPSPGYGQAFISQNYLWVNASDGLYRYRYN